jgi:hypothetical protein
VAVGCSSEQPVDKKSPPASTEAAVRVETTTTTSPADQEPIAKNLGDIAGAGCPSQDSFTGCTITFTITKVTDCTGDGYAGDPPPAGTHRKLAWVEIQTGSAYSTADLPSYLFTDFAAINANGVTTGGNLNPSTGWDCAPTQASIGFGDENWLPGRKYAGAIEIYLPDDAVKIVNGQGIWEWALQ